MPSTPRRRGSQESATLAGNQLIGDIRQRITVPLPQTVKDLGITAERHFPAYRGLYQHGKYKMHKPQHAGYLQDGDVIVVRKEPRKHEPPTLSTHQTDYIEHPLEMRAHAGPPRELPQTVKFEGSSAYHNDYVAHPIEMRKPAQAPQSNWAMPSEPTGQTTYQMEYPKHDLPRNQAARPMNEYQPFDAPFEGVSSYHTDYIKHAVRPRSAQPPQVREIAPGVFEGSSTYNVDFVKHPLSARQRPTNNYAMRADPTPFEGMTEYTREYLKHELARQRAPVVHIEPEIARAKRMSILDDRPRTGVSSSNGSRPKSAPSSRRSSRR